MIDKNLTEICKDIASKALQEPGTLVECMRPGKWGNTRLLNFGQIYKVGEHAMSRRLMLKEVRGLSPYATRFRKVN